MPPEFEFFTDIASKSLTLLIGEEMDIENTTTGVVTRARGIFDETITTTTETDVPIIFEQPNILMRNSETGGVLTYRDHKITRIGSNKSYRITDVERDELSTTRYIVEEVDNASS